MKAEWIANVNGQEYGPYTWEQMLQMAAEGRVVPDLPVRRVSDRRWSKASQIPGLLAGPKRAAEPAAATAPAVAASTASSSTKSSHSQLKRAKPLVVAPPPPPPPGSVAPPVGTAVAAGPPVVIAAPAPAKSTRARTDEEEDEKPRQMTPMKMLAICGGAVAGVALLGIAIVAIVWWRSASIAEQQAAAEKARQAAQELSDETDPGAAAAAPGAATEKKVKTTTTSAPQKKAPPANAPLSEQARLVKSIRDWKSLATLSGFGVQNARLQVSRTWRHSSAADSGTGKYICVEVKIENKSGSPLRYRGWNNTGPNGAILADEKLQVLPLIPVEKTPDIKRLTSSSIPGNSSATEILVFQAPASEDEVLHLVLPYGVFYSNVKPPYRALELTPDLIAADASSVAAGRGTKTGSSESPDEASTATTSPEPKKPQPAEADKPEAEKMPPKPPSLRDQINAEDDKKPKPDSDEPEKGKTEPAKGAKPENPFEPKPAAPR